MGNVLRFQSKPTRQPICEKCGKEMAFSILEGRSGHSLWACHNLKCILTGVLRAALSRLSA